MLGQLLGPATSNVRRSVARSPAPTASRTIRPVLSALPPSRTPLIPAARAGSLSRSVRAAWYLPAAARPGVVVPEPRERWTL